MKDMDKKKAKELRKDLRNLQMSIYLLDEYLESNWQLKDKALKSSWRGIFKALEKLGYTGEKAYDLTSHIRRYQKHEVQLRDGRLPTRMNKEYYYFYKSCDVRLMREILIDKSDSDPMNLNDWRTFDLITEINDDVEDVFEDQKTINGNMFLIQILEDGLESTVQQFLSFVDELIEKDHLANQELQNKLTKKILKWTRLEADLTKKLILKNQKKIIRKGLKNSIPIDKYLGISKKVS